MDIVNKSVIHHAYTEPQHSLFQRFSISKSEIVRDVIDISKKNFFLCVMNIRLFLDSKLKLQATFWQIAYPDGTTMQ